MKAGRPTYRVKARWICFAEDNNDDAFFQLNNKGEIVKIDNKILPHHYKRSEKKDNAAFEQRVINSEPLPLPVDDMSTTSVQPESELVTDFLDSFFQTYDEDFELEQQEAFQYFDIN